MCVVAYLACRELPILSHRPFLAASFAEMSHVQPSRKRERFFVDQFRSSSDPCKDILDVSYIVKPAKANLIHLHLNRSFNSCVNVNKFPIDMSVVRLLLIFPNFSVTTNCR